MLSSLSSALKEKEIRKRLLFTALIIILTRLGSQIPVPGVDLTQFRRWFAENGSGAFSLFSAFTGGSFERFSIFGLGVTPYITASIIIQLLAVAIPALDELRRDGEYGRKKIEKISRWTAIALAAIESAAMAIGFGKSGLLPGMNVWRILLVAAFMTGGSAILILFGKLIDDKGIGNGISIILMVNILAGVPKDVVMLWEMFIKSNTVAKGILAAVIIVLITVGTVILVVILNEAVRNVPVQHAGKLTGRSMMAGTQRSVLPIKVNVSNVMPVIFASSILSLPQMIAAAVGAGRGTGPVAFLVNMTDQGSWFDPVHPEYTIGLAVYLVLVFFFAFFYASISCNPTEIADGLRKSGATIPGIRPGKPTEEYLNSVISRLVVIGATGLIIVTMIPLLISGIFHARLSLGGTSVIIIVGVILETLAGIEAKTQARRYKGFLD